MHYQPKCNHFRHAAELCIGKQCLLKNCFCCNQCKRLHPKNCQFIQYKKFVYQLHKRQGLTKQQFCRYQERVQNTFNTLIKALKKQFIEFRQKFERFNATSEIVEFYDLIQTNSQKKLCGQMANQLLQLQVPKMQNFKLRDEIEMKRLQNNILAVNSYVINKLKPYYELQEKFRQVQVETPQINELKEIQTKYMDRQDSKEGLLQGDLRYFEKLLGKKVYNIQMLYKASQSGFSCRKFHQLCDGRKNTLVMAKTQFGKTVGLWCPFTWQSPQKWVYLKDSINVFMFSMEKQLKGLKLEPVKPEYAVGMHMDYGPIFGDDFVIYDKAKTSKSCWSNFPDVYNCKQEPLEHSLKILAAFIGAKDHFQKFNLVQWEVYKISMNRSQDLDVSWMKAYQQI